MEKARKIIVPIIALICIASIIYLVFFFGKNSMPNDQLTTVKLKDYTISFSSPTLQYKNGINFMDGVSASDDFGNDLKQFVTVSCKPTKNLHTKTLTYSINKAGYKILTFERELIIQSSYEGPSIKVLNSCVKVPLDQAKNISAIIAQSNAIETDDGFGSPCSISAEIQGANELAMGDYVATVTAHNLFGDTATEKITVTITKPEASIIKLSASSITLQKGDNFEPMDYVVSAHNSEYGDLMPYIYVEEIDTSKAGIYTVEYKFRGIRELESESAYLYVTVE